MALVFPHGAGYVVNGAPPISYTDAERQARALQAVENLEGSGPDQKGEGIASSLRKLAGRIAREAVQRKLGLHHVSNVSKLLGHLSKHHAGVAEEDVEHAAVSLDVYSPP